MSYDGEYGANETCRHDRYYRSCEYCSRIGPNATQEQYKELARQDEEQRAARIAAQKTAAAARIAEARSRSFPATLNEQRVERTITYRVEIGDFVHYDCYNYQRLMDKHPVWKRKEVVEAKNDREARAAATRLQPKLREIGSLRKHKQCPQHGLGIEVIGLTKVVKEKTADGWERTTELPVSLPKEVKARIPTI